MDFYKAYAAVHNSDLRQEIDGVRDEISEMDFSLVSDAEVISIAEEVLGGVDVLVGWNLQLRWHTGHGVSILWGGK